MDQAIVSIIVLAQQPDTLPQTLSSLAKQSFKSIEVLMLDNSQSKDIQKICQGFERDHSHFSYFRNVQTLTRLKNLHRAFHLGVGQYFLLLDDHMIPSPSMIEKLVQTIETDQTLACVLPEINSLETQPYLDARALNPISYDFPRSFKSLCETGPHILFFNSLMRRDLIEKVLPLGNMAFGLKERFLFEMGLYGGFRVCPDAQMNITGSVEEPLISDEVPSTDTLSDLSKHIPFSHHITLLSQRIAQSFFGTEEKKILLEIFNTHYISRFHDKIETECDQLCNLINSQLKQPATSIDPLLSAYFINSAVNTISDLIQINPQNQSARKLLMLLTARHMERNHG